MSGPAPQTAFVDVFLLLRDAQGRLLFGLRADHLYAGGRWNLVSGKVDEGEDVITAVIREAREEVGLALRPEDVTPRGVVHIHPRDGRPRVGFAFLAEHSPVRHGEVANAEPDKCDRLLWANPAHPPEPLEAYNAAVLTILSGQAVVVVRGWHDDPVDQVPLGGQGLEAMPVT